MAKKKAVKADKSNKKTIPRDAQAAKLALVVRRWFAAGPVRPSPYLERTIDFIVRNGTAAEATLTFVAIPAKPEYAQIRMTLLGRILLLPEWQFCTPWYEQKLKPAQFLPDEEKALEAYITAHPELLAEHLAGQQAQPTAVLQ